MKNKIIFINQPKLSGHLVDEELDKNRIALVPQIENFLSENSIFKDSLISVTFFHTGVSSLVCLTETTKEKYVLKVRLREGELKSESIFLEKWASVGVRVPHIYETGMIGEHSYFIMEYIDADIIMKAYTKEELVDKKMFIEMGKTLRVMHKATGSGYGFMGPNGGGEYETFKDWVFLEPRTQNQIAYIKENNILPEDVYGSIDNAISDLVKYVEENPKSVYCHFDFSPGNIINTDPITVFDPTTMFNHPYLDLAKSIVQSLSHCGYNEVGKQLIDGYFGEDKDLYNPKILQCAILFISYTKFAYWHKKDKLIAIDSVKRYLIENKNLL